MLDKEFLRVPTHKQYFVGIENKLKLPKYWRTNLHAE